VIVPKPPSKLKGRPTFDARGNVTWKFSERTGVELQTESVKALADGLSLEGASQEACPDPYNQAPAPGKEKTKGRSLDDMRRLNEEMKREHEELVKSLRKGGVKPEGRSAGGVRHARLRLKIGERELLVDEGHPSVSIGRSEDNDVVIEREQVSREHARIQYLGHELVLVDRSANGTFVQTAGGKMSRVRGGSARLDREGVIGFGRRPRQGSPDTMHFVCEEV
jgi:hypothetical protein